MFYRIYTHIGVLPTFTTPAPSSGGLDLLAAAAALASSSVSSSLAIPAKVSTTSIAAVSSSNLATVTLPTSGNVLPTSIPGLGSYFNLPPLQNQSSTVSIPDKIDRDIVNLEFIQMAELLPEA